MYWFPIIHYFRLRINNILTILNKPHKLQGRNNLILGHSRHEGCNRPYFALSAHLPINSLNSLPELISAITPSDATVSIADCCRYWTLFNNHHIHNRRKALCNYGKCRLPYVVGGTSTIIACYMNVYCHRCMYALHMFVLANRTKDSNYVHAALFSPEFCMWLLIMLVRICHCWKTGHICGLFISGWRNTVIEFAAALIWNLPKAASLCYCILSLPHYTTAQLLYYEDFK